MEREWQQRQGQQQERSQKQRQGQQGAGEPSGLCRAQVPSASLPQALYFSLSHPHTHSHTLSLSHICSEVSCQLGAVYGLQGDLCKDVGDMEAASGLYRRSMAVLKPHAERDPEVRGGEVR